MRAKTQLFLYTLLWTAKTLARPGWRNATESFEGWAYRSGLLQEIQRLEAQELLEQRKGGMDRRLVRLTEQGRVPALGGRDPVAHWGYAWDGKWRMVMFDLPKEEERLRTRLRRALRENGFGLLQRSVWVTPRDLAPLQRVLPKDDQVKTFIFIEGRPCGGERDAAIVDGAWDWSEITVLYQTYLNVLGSFPEPTAGGEKGAEYAEAILAWAKREAEAWNEAVQTDPLLPQQLHPRGYLGTKAWNRKIRTLLRAGQAINRIDPVSLFGAIASNND
jgi:phenylacetic acid degradation operon negative regulatory protein